MVSFSLEMGSLKREIHTLKLQNAIVLKICTSGGPSRKGAGGGGRQKRTQINAHLLGLLAMIKCIICSYQCDNWYVSNWRLACCIMLARGGCLPGLPGAPVCLSAYVLTHFPFPHTM